MLRACFLQYGSSFPPASTSKTEEAADHGRSDVIRMHGRPPPEETPYVKNANRSAANRAACHCTACMPAPEERSRKGAGGHAKRVQDQPRDLSNTCRGKKGRRTTMDGKGPEDKGSGSNPGWVSGRWHRASSYGTKSTRQLCIRRARSRCADAGARIIMIVPFDTSRFYTMGVALRLSCCMRPNWLHDLL